MVYLESVLAERSAQPSADRVVQPDAASVARNQINDTGISKKCPPAGIASVRIAPRHADKICDSTQLAPSDDDSRPSWRAHKRQGLPDRIARDLAAAILSGIYKPGDRLFGEIAFSDRLNVSRTTFRQAIQILTTKGLVSSNPRRGTIVNARSMWLFLDPDVLNLLLETGPDQHALEELRELLHMLAPKAAALAAERRSDEMLTQMQADIDYMKRVDPTSERGHQACQNFHLTVFLASGNSYVISLARGSAAALDAALAFRRQRNPATPDPVADHLNILAAIAAQDSVGAERASRTLIEHAFLDVNASN